MSRGLTIPAEAEHYLRQQRSHADDYVADCLAEFAELEPLYRPGPCLDIGCGIGGPTVLMARVCGGPLYICDGTGWAERRVGFDFTMAPFNDITLTHRVLCENGVELAGWVPPGAVQFPQVATVQSLYSWGWHYPVPYYLQPVLEALELGGVLIIDIRNETRGRELLEEYFSQVREVRAIANKGYRLCCKL